MRLCRFLQAGQPHVGYFDEQTIIPVSSAALAYTRATGRGVSLPGSGCLLDYLPPSGPYHASAKAVGDWLLQHKSSLPASERLATDATSLLVPIPKPNKIFLLAGNYADHIKEGGGMAAERAETFPYVFMKPPTTTLVHPGHPVRIPSVSPKHIDWELELAVVIGRVAKGVKESDALGYVAGYTVINDISDRKFRPNPSRKQRDKDSFFDWMHGKWHDGFCPCGPCVTSADAVPDPQKLAMKLTLNGETRQDASTALQIFPVAAVIEFISSFVTLEPGDLISTGTPAGVGNTTGTYVKSGDVLKASIEGIGTLTTPILGD